MKEIVKLALCLFLICSVVTGLLAVANEVTAPIIAQRQADDAKKAREALIAGADSFEKLEDMGENPLIKEVYAAKAKDEIIGYTVEVVPNGYGGAIDTIIGVSADGTVQGIQYIEMSETPGLGEKVREQEFYSQFIGKTAGAFSVVKSGAAEDSDILAVSGATISSRAVTDGVNAAVEFVKQQKEAGNS